MTYTQADYERERAICDKAAAYAESLMCEGGAKRKRNYITAEEAANPIYAACDNAMRGRVEQFDIVLMNPPFDRGRDCDHVRHAWQFVKPGGRLVAIMSARAEFGEDARHRALHKIVESAESCLGWAKWHDLPPGSFAHAGTMVNTVALTLRKPRA